MARKGQGIEFFSGWQEEIGGVDFFRTLLQNTAFWARRTMSATAHGAAGATDTSRAFSKHASANWN